MTTFAAVMSAWVLSQAVSGDVSESWARATGSTTARYIADRFATRVDVMDFGASGVGNATADTRGIVAAVAAAPDNAIIIFPAGTYRLNAAAFREYDAHWVDYKDLGAPYGRRMTIVQVRGKKNLILRGEGADLIPADPSPRGSRAWGA
ncbi:MAG: hypothetical protein QM767_14450 [Anaeromyxobacter sp.]